MNTYYFRTIFAIAAVSLLLKTFWAQDNNVLGSVCADVSQHSSIPTSGNIKALIIFVKYQDDNFLPDFPDWPTVINGHNDERPAWTENMLTKRLNFQDYEPSITGYYRKFSSNNINIYGDIYPEISIYPKLYLTKRIYSAYTSNCYSASAPDISTVIYEAIQDLDDEIDFSQYDNNQDGYVDEIIFWFRFGYFGTTDCSQYNGIAKLTGYYHNDFIDEFGNHIAEIQTNDGVKISYTSGLIADGPSKNAVDIMAHEIHHTMGKNYHYLDGWHLAKWDMSDARTGVGIPATFEILDCNWPRQVTEINTSGTYNITLQDYETTGESIKLITLGSGQYRLENRSGLGFYSKVGNWVMPGNGLLIYENDISSSWYQTVECADHIWNWQTIGASNCAGDCNRYGIKFLEQNQNLVKILPSLTGYRDIDMFQLCTSNSACFKLPNASGDAGDLYNPDYNVVFSHWSNPKAVSAPNSQPIVIEHLGKNADSSINLLIKYGVYDAYNGTSPSKPLLYKIEDVYCDGFYSHPKITWLNNTEPDMLRNGEFKRYRIYRAWSNNPEEEPSLYLFKGCYDDYTPDDTASYIDWSDAWIPCSEGSGIMQYTYRYKIIAVDTEEKFSVFSDYKEIKGFWHNPDNFNSKNSELFSSYNYPNPFNPSTDIKYSIPKDVNVKITVYNIAGEEVIILVNEYKSAGNYSVKFDGTNLASGIYFYRIKAGDFTDTKKMVLIK